MKNLLKPIRLTAIAALLLLSTAHQSMAQIPDLTNGGVRTDEFSWNLGPTGMAGWFYRPNWTAKYAGWNTEFARQIEVTEVSAGSPADGILQLGDVILGADGTGAEPVNFSYDARKAFADALADAEANSPAVLKLKRWQGTAETSTVQTVADLSGSLDGKYFILYDAAGSVGVWIDVGNSGTTIPTGASSADRAIEVTGVLAGDSAGAVASAIQTAINADSAFSAALATDIVTVTAATGGARTDIADGDTGFILAVTQQGGSVIDTVSLTLETLGAYSATAPYNCPKSAAILEKGLDAVMAQGGTDEWKFSLVTLLAGNDPSNSDNAARMARAKQEAHALILTQEQIADCMAPEPLTFGKVAWHFGFKLTALAEYYLHTKDEAVYESLRAYAIATANGQSMFGTSGHQFAQLAADGSLNGPYGIGYGVVSSANMQCFLGLTLAKEAGVTDQAVLDAVERAANFYSAYVDRGSIPYGEHEPMLNYGENGKNGIAALCFKAEGTRNDDANYYATLAASAAHNLDAGHQGPWLNYLWTPLGANAAGEDAMAAFFAEQSWRFDLARNYDGTFTYNSYQNGGQYGYGGPTWSGKKFQMYQAMLLPYAAPLRETYMTGKNTADPAKWIGTTELSEIQVSSGYDATTRTTSQLLAEDLDNWSPVTRIAAAAEIGKRTAEHATLLPTLHTMATDTNASLQSRMGACRALGQIRDGSSVSLLVGLLTDPNSRIKWAAATALGEFSAAALMPEIDAIMTACIDEGKPVLPIDPEDPIHLTHMEIVELLFFKMLRSHDLVGINRDLLIPAIRAGATHPTGTIRSDVGGLYRKLSREEVEGLADILVDGTMYEAPADRMFSVSGRMAGLKAIQSHNFAEGVRMAMTLALELNSTQALDALIAYAADALLVEPDHEVLKWLDAVEANDAGRVFTAASNWPDPGTHNHIDWVRDAINSDPGPYEKPESFKRIYRVYADDATLTLPDDWTGLHVGAYDFAKGDSVYTWRKVHGAGEVNFYPNGTAAAKDTAVVFDGIPGEYLFEVKMSDSRGFAEVRQTVAVTLEKVGGGLDPNSPPTANAQSVTVGQGAPTAIVLTGSDPEGHSLLYTVTSGPSHGTLSGTAPSLVYTASPGYTGSDSISFEVMDSEGQVHSGTVSITVNAGAPVGLAIYEPFAGYPQNPTNINGFAGTSEIGFADASTWTAGNIIYADDTATTGFPAGGYAYGPLPTTGSKLWLGGLNAPGLSRPIHPDALTNSGLLADGATLWFSALIGADDAPGRRVTIALANAGFESSSNNITDDGADPGTGLGFQLNDDKQFYAVQLFDSTQGGILRGDFNEAAAGKLVRNGDLRLIVGKITWGATSDTVEMYLPLLPDAGDGIVLPDEPSSTLVANVDQSKFDVLAVSRGQNNWVDEIRVGATLQSVLMGTVDAGGIASDGLAPTPNPMTFAIAPQVSSQNSITMTATPAYDPLGVEYYFTCAAGAGGSDSGWQDSNVYTDTGLTPGIAYSYTVKARDKTPGLNETVASSAASATIPSLGTVPGVVGLAQASAESLITDAGMVVGSITNASSYSLTVPAGHVLSQTPTGSSSAAYGSLVDLEISIGQAPTLPTLASVDIVDDQGGMHVTLPATITYTLTFSQDMDASTIDAGDFINLAGVPLTIGAINEITPGVVTVEVTPNTIEPGYVNLAIAQGAVINDALGNSLNTTSAIADEDWIPLLRPDNYVPTVDAGVDQTIEINSAQPWSPAAISSAAWFDAADFGTITQSGGKVSKWDDKSGNGNHASQGNTSTQPSYNSSDANLNNLPTIGYDQAFKTLVTANSFSAQRAYVVTYYDQATFGSWHNAVTDKGNTIRFVGGNSGQNYLTSSPATTGTAYQNGDRSANLVDGSKPAVLPMSASVWTVTANALSLDQWILLGGSPGYSGWENGALGEVILTDGTESLETQQKIEGYLAHKWGLEANLPPEHPFRYQEPQLKAATAVLDATVLDYDNDPLETLWTLASGPYAVNFSDAASVDGTASFAEPGTYTLRLTADDGTAQSSDEMTVTVNINGIWLFIDLPQISENGGSSTATVFRESTSGDLLVNLSSSDTSELTVPASVTIPDGQSQASFTLTAQDDALTDGIQTVTITATSSGSPDRTATINVLDDEAVLTLAIAATSIGESDGLAATTGTVTRNTDTTSELVVYLSSNDTSEVAVPASVTIPAGQTSSPAFAIDAVNDAIVDGTQMASVTAIAAGYDSGTDTLDVTDDPTVTLTLSVGSGVGTTSGPGAQDPDASPFAITASPGQGYVFDQWRVTSGPAVINDPSAASALVTASANSALEADFVLTSHPVTYNGNGSETGDVPTDASSPYNYGSSVTVLGNSGGLTRANHSFAGWNTASDGSGTAYVAGDVFPITEDTVLYAQWAIDTHTVTYSSNLHDSGVPPVDGASPHDFGSTVTVLDNTGLLARANYGFIGWNTAVDGSGLHYLPGETFTITGNVTLHAQWLLDTHTVTYDGNGSDGGGVPVDASSPYNYNSTVTVLENSGSLSLTGHTFAGWNTASDGSGTAYAPAATFTLLGDTVLYAQWTINSYNVTYDGNGSDSGTVPVDASNPYVYDTNVAVLGNSGTLVRTGHTFAGWNTASDGSGTSYVASDIFAIAGETVLYALWDPETYTVGYSSDLHDSGTTPVDALNPHDYGSSVAVLDNTGLLTRANYTFTGWNTSSDGSGVYFVPGETFVITGDVILHAQWVFNTHSVSYDGNGSDGGAAPVDALSPYDYGSTVSVLGNTGPLTRSGHTFAGWNTSSDGTGTAYTAGATFTLSADTVLYAQWTINSYNVTYDGNGSDSGTAPVDASNPYVYDTNVAVLGNSGTLVRTGYSFAGWNTASDGSGTSYVASDIFAIAGETVLYALWDPETYTINYNGNWNTGGAVPAHQTKTFGTALTLALNSGGLSRDGYAFDGWNTASDGSGIDYAEGAAFNMEAPTTLYAKWNTPPSVEAGAPQTVQMQPANIWTPTEITTVAWFDAADGSTITQSAGAVSQWRDKSGNGLHAGQGSATYQPAYNTSDTRLNNLPTIGYDQGFKYLQTPTIASIQNVYVVTYYDDPNNTFDTHRVLFSDTGNNLKLQGKDSNWVSGYGFNKFRDGSTTSSDANALPMGPTLWTAKGTASHTNKAWRILGGINGFQYWEYGAVGEVILTDGTEDLATQQKIEGYLAHKWGLEANLPVDHPYRYVAPGGPTATAPLSATVEDVDNDSLMLQWTMVSGPVPRVDFTNPTGAITNAIFSDIGTYTLRLTANDGFHQVFDDVVITVEEFSDVVSPTLSSTDIVDDQGGADVIENSLVTYSVTFSEDMDAATVEATDFGNAGTAPITVGAVTETSPGIFSVEVTPTGTGTLQLQVNAGAILNDLAGNALDTTSAIADDTTINVVVAPPNNAPVFTADPFSASAATEDIAYVDSIAGSATDADAGDTLSYSKVSGPAWLSVGIDGTLSGTPFNADVGANSFIVSVTDGIIVTPVEATLNITVINTNDAPVFTVDPINGSDATEGFAYTGSIVGSATDEDIGDTLTYAKVSGPVWLSVGIDGTLSGTPTNSDVGANAFTVSVSDGTIVTPVEATLNITVNAAPTESGTPILIDWSTSNDISGLADANGNYWNSLGAGGVGDGSDLPATALVDSSNGASGISVAVDLTGDPSNFTGSGFGGAGINGPTGTNPFDITGTDRPTVDGLYANYNANGTSLITFTGLAPSTQYAFAAIGGRASGGTDGVVEVLQGSSEFAAYTLLNKGTVLNFSVTSSATGTIQFEFSEIVDDTDGGSSATWNALSLTPPTPFEAWVGDGSTVGDDSNGDGISNGLAWVLGAGDFSSDASSLLPTSDSQSDPEYYIFTYRRADEAQNDPNTSIAVVYCEDMSAWTTAVHDGLNVIITETDDGYAPGVDLVEVKINWDLVSGNKIFARLRVEISP